MSTQDSRRPGATARAVFTVPFRAQTYRNLAYVLLAFPLGMAYFVAVSAGLSMGLGLAVTLVGLPILLVTLLGAVVIAGFEAELATRLVDEVVPQPSLLVEGSAEVPDSWSGLFDAVSRIATSPSTWLSLLLVAVKFAFGIVAFVVTALSVTLTGALLGAPLLYDTAGFSYQFGTYTVGTFPEALALCGVGAVLALATLHLMNGLAKLGAVLTASVLGLDGVIVSDPN